MFLSTKDLHWVQIPIQIFFTKASTFSQSLALDSEQIENVSNIDVIALMWLD